MGNEYKDFNYFYVEKSLYYFGIESELSLACSKLFRAILYKFNSKYFPSALVISSRELSNLTGLEYCNIARVREKLLAYRYEKEPIVVYIKEPNQKYYYVLNKRLFTNLYKLIDRDVSDGMIPPGTENFLIDSAYDPNKFVYIISYDNYVKIGKTSNVQKRFNSLKGMSNIKIELLWYATETESINEQLLHDIFKQYRSHNEYFEYSAEIKDFIESHRN